MLKQKISQIVLVLIVILFSFTSCKSDDPVLPTSPSNEVKSGVLSGNETWTADRIYKLDGKVFVPSGVTLTIKPGTIIKGLEGDGLDASALVVARGGKLMAEGTSTNPIIFTSTLDNIKIGEKTGTNLDENDVKKWGGLIVLGKAKVSAKVGDTEGHIEGIPANDSKGTYGGTDDADTSGVIKYVSIRHGGIAIGEGNEINGLTLGGVGNGTTIDYVEVFANLDDGIECFGGSVIINHALVAYQQDDAFDIDQNFSGSFINSMVVYDSSVGDEFLEIDGPENSTYTNGKFLIENCTFIDKNNNGSCDFKSKAQGECKNNVFEGLSKFKLSLKLGTDCTTLSTDAYTRYISQDLKIGLNKTDAPLSVYTKSNNGATPPVTCNLPATAQNQVNTIFNAAGNSTSASAVGAAKSAFDNWTWTAINNKF